MKRGLLAGILMVSCGLAAPALAQDLELHLMKEQLERIYQEINDLEKGQTIRGLRDDPEISKRIWEKRGELLELEIRIARHQARLERDAEKDQARQEKEAAIEVQRQEREHQQEIEEARTIAEAVDLLPLFEEQLQELVQSARMIHAEYELGLASYQELIRARSRVFAQQERVQKLQHLINPLVGEQDP